MQGFCHISVGWWCSEHRSKCPSVLCANWKAAGMLYSPGDCIEGGNQFSKDLEI